MYHSITFIKKLNNQADTIKNTWEDWHLIPSAEPVFVQPNPVYNYVDIPGSDGSMDLTDYLIGRPTFSDRQGTFEFMIVNSYDPMWGSVNNKTNQEIRDEMAEFLDGSIIRARLQDDDPSHYYEGRFFFKGRTPDANHSKITIEYRVKPYRYNNGNGGEAGL